MVESAVAAVGRERLARFWQTARGFWSGSTRRYAWGLIGFLVVCVVLQLLVQYRLNLWNRDFFNALERREGGELWYQARTVLGLVAQSVVLAIAAVWGRMSFQRRWRDWLTSRLIALWLTPGGAAPGETGNAEPQFAEYRIAEDARIATDAPIDFVVGLLSSILSAGTFIVVLWHVGGSINLGPFGVDAQLPGYLVFAAVLYAALTTTVMMVIAGNMASVIERKNQAESEFKFAVAQLQEHLKACAAGVANGSEPALAASADASLQEVIRQWRRLCGQHMRTTLVSHGDSLLAPVMGLILCVPNYVHGTMQLGEMTQSAGAFVAVQGAFNWLVHHYPRLADWASSASRVGVLLSSFAATRDRRESGIDQQRQTSMVGGTRIPPDAGRRSRD